MLCFSHFHSTRDVTFHVSVVGCFKFPREVMWLSRHDPINQSRFLRHATDAGFSAT
ncbi:MAG: hypothetical protein PV344_02865 [Anaplasma sp.]|nr:hypothetical protein [Anaplasma sp.]